MVNDQLHAQTALPTTKEIPITTHQLHGSLDPINISDMVMKGKLPIPIGNINHNLPTCSQYPYQLIYVELRLLLLRLFCLPTSYIKAQILTYTNYHFNAVLCECETWFLTPQGMSVFENGCWGEIFGPKIQVVTLGWRKLPKSSFIIFTLHRILLGWYDEGMHRVWAAPDMHTKGRIISRPATRMSVFEEWLYGFISKLFCVL
jgi:hypothetical protein